MQGNSEKIQRMYDLRFDAMAQQSKDKIWQVIVREFLQKWVGAQAAVLDLGCGYGEFLNHVQCARRVGVDLNPDSHLHLAKGIEFHQGSVTGLPFLGDGCMDVVFASNLMEHLESKAEVQKMIREVRRVLKPAGHFIALGPNLRFLPGEYWDFWDHVIPITDRSLVETLRNEGFEPINVIPKFLPYTTCSPFPKSAFLISLYLKFPIAWCIFGRQFLIRVCKS